MILANFIESDLYMYPKIIKKHASRKAGSFPTPKRESPGGGQISLCPYDFCKFYRKRSVITQKTSKNMHPERPAVSRRQNERVPEEGKSHRAPTILANVIESDLYTVPKKHKKTCIPKGRQFPAAKVRGSRRRANLTVPLRFLQILSQAICTQRT